VPISIDSSFNTAKLLTDFQLPQGVYAAGLSPLPENLSVAHGGLLHHYRWLLANGCTGIVFMGTTGEANSFSVRERIEALESLIDGGIPAHLLMVGTGCCALTDTVTLTSHAVRLGVGGVLMLPPFYYKEVSDEGIFRSFEQVIKRIDGGDLRIYLYHFPQMSQVPFSHDLIARLMQVFPGVFKGVKDSSGDWQNMKTLVEWFPELNIFAGTERYLSDILQAGGAGCISASANVTCPLAGAIYSSWLNGNKSELQEELIGLRSQIERYPMIPGLKYIMSRLTGKINWLHMRPPHAPLSRDQVHSLAVTVRSLQKIVVF